MTNEFDPTGGFQPDSVEAYEAEELRKETEAREQGDRNEAAGLNRDGSPKEVPAVEPAPASKPKANLSDVRAEKIPFVKDAPLGNLSLSAEQLIVKNKLANEPKMPFYLPLDPGEKKGAVRPVIINTYRCEVPKGMQVQLPESICKLLMRSYDAEAQALSDHENNLNNADSDKRKALGLE